MQFSSKSLSTNSKKKKSNFFIPPYYEFKTSSLGKENFKLLTSNGETKMYITLLVRTILENIKTLNKPNQESLCRQIKEKLDSNSRLILKKATSKSKTINIKGEQFIFVNANIIKVDDNTLRIMNDKEFESSMI